MPKNNIVCRRLRVKRMEQMEQFFFECFRLQHFLCIGEQQRERRTPLSILVFFFLHVEQKSVFLSLFVISPNLKIFCFLYWLYLLHSCLFLSS